MKTLLLTLTLFLTIIVFSSCSDDPVTTSNTPSAPQGVTVTPGDSRATIKWSAPSSIGGSAVTQYKIYRGTTAASLTNIASVDASVTTYVDSTITNGTNYLYAVAAVNSFGEGTRSAEIAITPSVSAALYANWLSEGANVAPGLRAAPFRVVKITATFNSNSTYTVISTDSAGATITYTGTFTATAAAGTTIRAITLNQQTPSSITSEGIFRVDGTLLTYEVIQTQPAIPGFLPPTPAAGFGSTSYNGIPLGALWIQKFVKTN